MEIVVSVIMITYNHEAYISQAIEGVLMQNTNFNFELIVADDSSKDNTQNIIRKYAEVKPEIIRPILRNKNIGANYNWIDALNHCNGKYIALCEGDDYWINPHKLQKQIDFLESNPEYTFSMGRVDILVEKTGKILKGREPKFHRKNDSYNLKDYLKSTFSQTSTFVFKNTKEPFPEWFFDAHAGDYSLVLIKTGNGLIKYHRDLFSIYRVNQNSISHTVKYNVYEKFLEISKKMQHYLGKDYKFIFKLIRYRVKQENKLFSSRHRLIRIIYRANIMGVDIVLTIHDKIDKAKIG